MTELTDEAVKALLAHYDLPTDCDCDGDDCIKCSHYPTLQECASKQLKDAVFDLARTVIALHAKITKLRRDLERRDEMHQCAMLERDDAINHWQEERAERDTLAAEVARLRDRERVLVGALENMRKRAMSTRGEQAYRELPKFVLNTVRAALATDAEKAGAA